jgi:hypothetical protein
MCFSEDEPYLNFLSIDEIEEFRGSIINGSTIKIKQDTFREAEEAYSAAGTIGSPQALKYFAKISHPVMVMSLLLFIVFVLIGS